MNTNFGIGDKMNTKMMARSVHGKILLISIGLGPNTVTMTYEHKFDFLAFMDFYVRTLAGSR